LEPGSGPAHLSLFGYDPLRYIVGRGVLEALGIGFALQPGDLAARGNFATVDSDGVILDRRAGRIPTAECERLTGILQQRTAQLLPGCEVFVLPVKEHRFALIVRGEGLGGDLSETDPLVVGERPLPVVDRSGTAEGERTAALVNRWVGAAREALAGEDRANSLNLRALAKPTPIPSMAEIYGLRAAAIAVYPMYRGLASLAGMDVLPISGERPADEVAVLEAHWADYDYFFVHIKKTDSYGEDGDFEAKAREIEAVDAIVPRIFALQTGVLIVTGDHSTPAALRRHSWHPVPALLWGPRAMPDAVACFGERACASGSLGVIHATSLMPLAMAHADRLHRFGA
jgi:2,3-bisphosphoglycerate-independent phosphoglycerate mutase